MLRVKFALRWEASVVVEHITLRFSQAWKEITIWKTSLASS
jgi:hypothetical protein